MEEIKITPTVIVTTTDGTKLSIEDLEKYIIVFTIYDNKGLIKRKSYKATTYNLWALNQKFHLGDGWDTTDSFTLPSALTKLNNMSVNVKFYALKDIEELAIFIQTPLKRLK